MNELSPVIFLVQISIHATNDMISISIIDEWNLNELPVGLNFKSIFAY